MSVKYPIFPLQFAFAGLPLTCDEIVVLLEVIGDTVDVVAVVVVFVVLRLSGVLMFSLAWRAGGEVTATGF